MFKKSSIILVIVLLSMLMFTIPVVATGNYDYVKTLDLFIGDKEALVNNDLVTMDQAPYVKNGRTLVPFRFLGDSLGATVDWDSKTKTAILKLKDKEVKVTIGSTTAYINGTATTLQVAAETKGGRTFIPLRFVSEAMGADVEYDQELEMISIILVDMTGWKEYKVPSTGEEFLYPADWNLNATSGFEIVSPLGSKVIYNLVNELPSDAAKGLIDKYLQAGYEKESEEPNDPANPSEGSTVTFVKLDPESIENSKVAVVITQKDGDKTAVVELDSKFEAGQMDFLILEKMFPEN